MEFELTKVFGRIAHNRNSLALLPSDGQRLTYAACIGAGAKIVSRDSHEEESERFFYEPPTPYAVSGQSPSSSPRSSPSLRPTGGSKLVRVNKSNCVAVAPNNELLAVGENGGYMPRLLLYSLNSGACLDIVRDQHQFGVHFLKFSASETYLASLGTPQDGFLYVWKVSSGKLSLHCSNKCISDVKDMIWLNDTQLVTVGVRHIKLWTVEAEQGLNGRNVVLGHLADETFECTIVDTYSDNAEFLVGTGNGGVFRMPNLQKLISHPNEAIKSLALSGEGKSESSIYIGTQCHIYRHDNFKFEEPAMVYTVGSSILHVHKNTVYYLHSSKSYTDILELTDAEVEQRNAGREVEYMLQKKGIQLRGCESSVLCWNDEDSSILRWPSEILTINMANITAADEDKSDNNSLIAGNLSGDIYIGGQKISAHSGPITDVHVLHSLLAVSCGRDRSVQIWSRTNTETAWSLKQTVLFTTPILKARLNTNSVGDISLTCCGANKTLYFYKTSQITYEDDGQPAFADSSRSITVKAMPFELTTSGELVVLSTNDKLVSIFDPFAEDKLMTSWRPTDFNGDLLNLNHIQAVTIESKQVVLGAASNKSVVAFAFQHGELIASLWGFGEPISGIAWNDKELIGASDAVVVSRLRPARESTSPQNSLASPSKGNQYENNTSSSSGVPPLLNMSRLNLRSSNNTGSSPLRKVYGQQKSASSRSRSMSPVRTISRENPLPDGSLTSRMFPKALSRDSKGSPSNEPLQRPNNSKPLLKNIPQLTNSCVELKSALTEFLNNPLPDSDLNETKQLLISALNKIDNGALFEQWTQRLEQRLGDVVASQIKESLRND